MLRYFTIFIFLFSKGISQNDTVPFIMVLGVAQDAGYPQIGCNKACCEKAWKNDSLKQEITCLALVSPQDKKWWLIEATPDISKQLRRFSELTQGAYSFLPDGIFITHAHIGHYTGLMQLGREAMNTSKVPVYVLPKMKKFLETNGPWNQLVSLKNIELKDLNTKSSEKLNNSISVETFTVPHRDEYSETAGFIFRLKSKKYLFIPDIDRWTQFNGDIVKKVNEMDYAFLDATFYSEHELPGRNIKEIPHPLVKESMQYFGGNFEINQKKKIIFIHFNHTNPLLTDEKLIRELEGNGYQVAKTGMKVY
ncbi:MAG: pyrroloquinoline quinone biosynthesis protein PqqB [Sphingobacteriaceae bacterium]|nr:pyrroloquinoline quinone biosynthesis protein PqqB [Sphingobacteriaceae bacterium]